MAKTTRRDFIKSSAAAVMLPLFERQAKGVTVVEALRDALVADNKILVIVELAGGNDPLNTIVPLQQYDIYRSFRSRLAIAKEQVLSLYGSTTMGLSPLFSAVKPIADAGKFAVVQSAHYPNPNLSHDGSRTIYRLADTATTVTSQAGWIGRHAALFGNRANPLDLVGVGGVNSVLAAPGAKVSGINADTQGNVSGYAFNTDPRFTGDRNNQLAAMRALLETTSSKPYVQLTRTVETDALDSADSVAQAVSAYRSSVTYPATNFAGGLKLIAKLAASSAPNLGARVYYISQGGYDTHANQKTDHPMLLKTLGEGLKAFYDDLIAQGIFDRTLVLLWSEFGRRVADNASDGTDHGAANNFYLFGGKVKGGVYGPDPNLTDLQSGNLKHALDFRDVYTTVMQDWFGNSASEAAQVLRGNFNRLGFLS